MAQDDLAGIKNLSPEERVKRLREITKKDKEEIKKAQDLIKETEIDIEEENKSKRQIPIPQLKSVDVATLFGRGTQEGQMFQTKRFQSPTRHKEGEEIIPEERPLEDTVDREPIKEAAKEEAEQQYILQLSRTPAEHLADRMQGIYQEALDRGYVSPNQIESATNISYALTEKKAEINLGNYDADQKVKEQILVSGNIIKALKDRYKGR